MLKDLPVYVNYWESGKVWSCVNSSRVNKIFRYIFLLFILNQCEFLVHENKTKWVSKPQQKISIAFNCWLNGSRPSSFNYSKQWHDFVLNRFELRIIRLIKNETTLLIPISYGVLSLMFLRVSQREGISRSLESTLGINCV